MNEQKKPSLKSLDVIYLSFFGVGFSKHAPGTMGTLAAIPFAMGISKLEVPTIFLIPLLVFATVGTCMATEIFQRNHGLHDPQWIVIDEVLGFFTAYVIMPAHSLLDFGLLFVLFRFFDIAKPWPASYFDKMEHGAGVILDDIVAGLMAGSLALALKIFIF